MSPIKTLEEQIKKAADQYWKTGRSFLTDIEYDKLVRKLEQLDPKNPILNEVGEDKTEGNKVAHRKPMLSLGKVYSWKELISWLSKVSRSDAEVIAVSPKYDGISLEQQGDIIVTRGKGYIGTDITHLAGHIGVITHFEWNDESEEFMDDMYCLSGILDHAEEDDNMVGELMISFKRFAELKEAYPSLFAEYKNCRNFISGFSNSKRDSEISRLKTKRGSLVPIATYVHHRAHEIKTTFGELRDTVGFEQRLERELRDFQGFPTDGLVFRLVDEKYAESLGATAHHPRCAIALKWTAEQASTKIKAIEWQVGNRHINPVAVFEPSVQLDGVEIERATLHCADWVKEHNACVGSSVTIERRGGVIPKVVAVENEKPDMKAVIIEKCPYCETKLVQEGKFLSCPNDECPGRCVNQIVHGLEYLGLKGAGPSLVFKAVVNLKIGDICTIMDWAKIFGDRSEKNLKFLEKNGFTKHEVSVMTRICEVMDGGVYIEDLLRSVCIPKCGIEFATTLEKKCGGIQYLMGFAAVDDMYNEIVGKAKLDSVTNFMIWMEENREKFVEYISRFKILKKQQAKGIVCFTGAGPEPRGVLESKARSMGYDVTSNATKCTMLVAEDPNGNSLKLQKARKNGIAIVSYEEFLKSH